MTTVEDKPASVLGLKYCAHQTCPNRVVSGYCPTHSRQKEQQRGSQRERGYTSAWEIRAKLFKQQYPLCGMRPNGQAPVMSQCHEQGLVTPAAVTDHVIPHRGNQELFWDELGNWQSLCFRCHSAKTANGL